MDDATNLHRVAQVVNTTRRSNPGSSSGPAIPTELTTWSGEADVNIDPATCCLGRCLMSTRCRPVMNMSSVRRHPISRWNSGVSGPHLRGDGAPARDEPSGW